MIYAPFTGGPLDGNICFVGQAPGMAEHNQGGAFVGPAGRELTRFCGAAGINREACRLENLFQFFPDNDDLDPYIKLGTKLPKATPIYNEHVEALRLRLLKCSANVIVPLGNISMFALTGQIGVGKWRGSILESKLLPGRKCIPTIHPSATLKGGDANMAHFIVYDLIRAKKEAEYPDIRPLKRRLLIQPSYDEVMRYIAYCRKQESVAYDIETRGMSLSHISFATESDLAMCIPFAEGAKDIWDPNQEAAIMLEIAKLLEDTNVVKIGQNLSFDCTFMYRRYGIHVRPIDDTMIAAAILYPDFPKGLDFLTSIYCDGEPYYKADGKNWMKNPVGNDDLFRRYNAMDSAVLMEIWPKQKEELLRCDNFEAYVDQRDLLHPLVYTGNRGILVDIDGMKNAGVEAQVRIKELDEELKEYMGDVNVDSSQQLINYFYVIKGIKPYMRRRAKGPSSPSVDEKALQRLVSTHRLPEAKLLIERRKLTKMHGTYYNMGISDDNRMRCSFNPVGTGQARISSSQTIWGEGGNMQNLPSDMQKLLLADPGGIFVSQDLAQAENRVVAYEAIEMKMIEALEAGIDIHSQTGCLIHGIPLDQCTPDIRTDGKVANHGLNYGFGANNFIDQYELDREQGKFIWERYHQVYPSIKEWHAVIRSEVSNNGGLLRNSYGRSRRFIGDPKKDHRFWEKAYNFIPQSTVATKINRDGVKFLYYRQDLFPEVQLSNTVHDSVQYWIPLDIGLDRVVEIIRVVKKQLEQPLEIRGRTFYIPADTKIGFSFDESTSLEWKAKKVDSCAPSLLESELEEYVAKAA